VAARATHGGRSVARSSWRVFLRHNGLTIGLLALFGVSVVGHALAGYALVRQSPGEHGEAPHSLLEYLGTAHFRSSLFENWESEFLQMCAYVLMTACLYQRGSAESRDPDAREPDDVDEDPRGHAHDARVPWPVRRGGLVLALYSRSLTIALLFLFAASFALHLQAGHAVFDAERASHGRGASTWSEYLSDPRPWFESFQNWQSEFLSVAVVVVLSIFLRQIGSPESKPVHAPHSRTGR
jgi:hypothetical protein